MRRASLVAVVVGLGLVAADSSLAPWMVRSEVVASLLSPDGLTAGRAAAALGYVAVRLLAVFVGPALIVGGAVGVLATRGSGTAA